MMKIIFAFRDGQQEGGAKDMQALARTDEDVDAWEEAYKDVFDTMHVLDTDELEVKLYRNAKIQGAH